MRFTVLSGTNKQYDSLVEAIRNNDDRCLLITTQNLDEDYWQWLNTCDIDSRKGWRHALYEYCLSE